MGRFLPSFFCGLGLLFAAEVRAMVDLNANLQSDVWEAQFNSIGLSPNVDSDGDGFSNAAEARAGTNALDLNSRPALALSLGGGQAIATWDSLPGKRYRIEASETLGANDWQVLSEKPGSGHPQTLMVPAPGAARYFRLTATDPDTDNDGLTDWEEWRLGLDAASPHSDRNDTDDGTRVRTAWPAASVVTVGAIKNQISERWPDPGVVAIRRSGGLKPIVVNFTLGGTATNGGDYLASAVTSVAIPAGAREVWAEFQPLADSANAEPTETITLTAGAGAGYVVAAPSSVTIDLASETAASPPDPRAAARFLVQAAFGPDQDSIADADQIPENVEEVVALGFSGWLDAQFAKPPTFLQPFTEAAASISEFYIDPKQAAWWNRAMGNAVLRITPNTWDWQNERVRLAIYLIVTSPEFCILR